MQSALPATCAMLRPANRSLEIVDARHGNCCDGAEWSQAVVSMFRWLGGGKVSLCLRPLLVLESAVSRKSFHLPA
jgi:hypothetical protein